MSKTPKVITEAIPPGYRSLPGDERKKIARKLAGQVRAGLRLGGTISEQLGPHRAGQTPGINWDQSIT